MGVFNVSFLKGGTGGGGGSAYSDAVTSVEILESTLKGDGILSAGDYDQLISASEKLASVGTASQRNEWKKRIAGYRSAKSQFGVGRLNDLDELNKSFQSDINAATMAYGNNLPSYMAYREASLRNKISRLSDSVEQVSSSGGNFSSHLLALNESLSELADFESAKGQMESGNVGDFVLYVDTNANGEIRSLDYGRPGKPGYSETNGTWNGFQVYGKPNTVRNGKKVFRMGNNVYQGTDSNIFDPDTGSMRSAPLLSSDRIPKNPFMPISPDMYSEVKTDTLRPQTYLPAGEYARGVGGTLYEALPQGGYRKYVDFSPDQLGIGEDSIWKVPQEVERGINMSVRDTMSGLDMPQMSMEPGTAISPKQQVQERPQVTAMPMSVERTRSPKERAPKTATGTARSTLQSVMKNYLGM